MKPTDKSDFTNKYARYPKSKVLQKLMTYPIAGLAVHWIFQGMLYMDLTERLFKIGLDVGIFLMVFLFLKEWVAWPLATILSFLLAHTINFLFNAQLWVLLKHYGYVNNSHEIYEQYTREVMIRIKSKKFIQYAAIYGSRIRGEWRQTSDLDLLLVRRDGCSNGIRACVFVLLERSRAFLSRFPLDIYVLDSFQPLERVRDDETPYVIMDGRIDLL